MGASRACFLPSQAAGTFGRGGERYGVQYCGLTAEVRHRLCAKLYQQAAKKSSHNLYAGRRFPGRGAESGKRTPPAVLYSLSNRAQGSVTGGVKASMALRRRE